MLRKKQRELFSLSDTIKGIIYYLPGDGSLSEIKKIFQQCYRKNAKFFKREVDKITLTILYDRQEMDEIADYKTQNWVVGYANSSMKNQIYMFSPEVFGKVSNHHRKEFKPILSHEIAHLFTRSIHKGYKPHWLYEGIACVVAGQKKLLKNTNMKFTPRIVSLLDTSKQWNRNAAKKSLQGYWQGWKAVDFLMRKYGKLQLFYFLSSLGDRCNKKIFYAKFRIVYNNDLLEIMKQIR